MFLRKIKSKNKTYLHLIETYREGGKVKHRSVAALGSLEQLLETDQLQRIGLALLKYSKQKPNLFDISGAEEKSRKRWGAVFVWKKLWEKFGLPHLFESLSKRKKIEFDFFSAVFLMLLDRLLEPKSKLKSYQEQSRYHSIADNPLHHLYRALDLLYESKEKIEEYLFEINRSLWNMKVDLVLYDVTSLYFESVAGDGFREFGYGKDGNVNEIQILLGLLLDTEGRPIGFDLFPGNTCEGKTIETALKKLSSRFKLSRLILIADQAMLFQKNLELIKEAGYEYIVGGKIRNRSNKIKAQILNPDGYQELSSKEGDTVLKVKTIKLDGADLISSWSAKRAQKDKRDRERKIEKAKKLIEHKKASTIAKRGALKYIALEGNLSGHLDEQKIEQDQRWDGYYGIETNCKDLSAQTLLGYYHDLWRIEESFRIFKSHLETRPVFHWTEKRIRGHLVLCFIAFLLERTLELELKNLAIESSPQLIRKALEELQFSEILIEGQTFYLRSPVTGLANDILRTLRIKIPPLITPADKFPSV